MITKMNHRRAIGLATAALALGVAGPAAARPFDLNSSGSFVPVNVGETPALGTPVAASHAGGGGSALEYALIGTGSASVLLVGIGGSVAANRRRQGSAARRSTLVT